MFPITVTDSYGTRTFHFDSETDAKREFKRIKRAHTQAGRGAKVTFTVEMAV